MNELAIGRRKEAAIFRQQGTVKAEKQAPASAAQSTRKPASTAASDSVQQRMTGALRAEALTRESRRTLQSGEAILSEVQESLGRLRSWRKRPPAAARRTVPPSRRSWSIC